MTKTVLGLTIILLISPVFYILSEEPAVIEEPDLATIIERAKEQQQKALEEVEDAIFMAESIYIERKKDGNVKKEVVTQKRIYTKGTNKRYDEYLSRSVNGRKLSKREMEKEVKKEERDYGELKLPLTPEGEGAYNFYLVDSDTINGVDAWTVEFRAKERKKGCFDGKGYISKESFDVIRAELAPAKISRLVKSLSVCVTFGYVQGYWLPAKFEVDVEIKVSFLYYKHVTIEETYSDHRLNNELDDSIFETK